MATSPPPTTEGIGEPERAAAELLNVNQVAKLLGVSTRTAIRMADAGRMPRPLKLTSRVARWRAAEMRQWIIDGCKPVRSMKRGQR